MDNPLDPGVELADIGTAEVGQSLPILVPHSSSPVYEVPIDPSGVKRRVPYFPLFVV